MLKASAGQLGSMLRCQLFQQCCPCGCAQGWPQLPGHYRTLCVQAGVVRSRTALLCPAGTGGTAQHGCIPRKSKSCSGSCACAWAGALHLADLLGSQLGPGSSPLAQSMSKAHSGLHPALLSAFGWFIPNPARCTNQCWGWAPSSRIPSTQLESPIPFTQSDSAGDEALKLYWKLLLFPKEMFEVLIGFFPRLNQDEREKNWNFFADLWFKYQGKGWASGMVPFLCWPFFLNDYTLMWISNARLVSNRKWKFCFLKI